MCDQPNPSCSGNGLFNNITNTCECFTGYSSLADYRFTTTSIDCDVRLDVVMALYITLGVMFFFPFALSMTRFCRSLRSRGWFKTIDLRSPQNRVHSAILIDSSLYLMLSIIKSVNVSTRLLGTDLFVTTISLFAHIFLPICMASLMDIMINLSTMQLKFRSQRQATVLQYMKVYEWILVITLGVAAFLLWIPVFYQSKGCGLLQSSLALNATVFVVGIVIPSLAVYVIIEDIGVAIKTLPATMAGSNKDHIASMVDPLKKLQGRLRFVRQQLFGTNVINALIFYAGAGSLFMLRKWFYIYPVVIMSGIPMLLVVATIAITVQGKQTPSSMKTTEHDTRIVAAAAHQQGQSDKKIQNATPKMNDPPPQQGGEDEEISSPQVTKG